MRTRTHRESRDAVVAWLRAVVSCVADRPLLTRGHAGANQQTFQVSFAPFIQPAPVRQAGGDRLLLDIRCEYAYADPDATSGEAVVISGYSYRILDRTESELLAYHFHPKGPSPITDPHIHVSGIWREGVTVGPSGPDLGDIHLPTSFVSLVDVVRLLIGEFDVFRGGAIGRQSLQRLIDAWRHSCDVRNGDCYKCLSHGNSLCCSS